MIQSVTGEDCIDDGVGGCVGVGKNACDDGTCCPNGTNGGRG